jgi:hypothetical protein
MRVEEVINALTPGLLITFNANQAIFDLTEDLFIFNLHIFTTRRSQWLRLGELGQKNTTNQESTPGRAHDTRGY